MNDAPSQSQNPSADESEDESSMIFAQMVMQLSNMALIFLGKTPNPQTGQTSQDLDHARYFIDQLEMLAVKTRGNLAPHEDSLLKQTLTGLRLAFVEAVSKLQPPASQPADKPANEPEPAKPDEPEPSGPAVAAAPADSNESHKKFTKKY